MRLKDMRKIRCKYRDSRKAYLNISFEREAYAHGHDLSYLSRRRRFGHLKTDT